jgi:ornithine decarboxylase
MRKSASALALVNRQNLSPSPLVHPIIGLRRHAATQAAQAFTRQFPGRTLYAVKANPSVDLLKTLFAAGITDYDVASIAEVRLVRKTLPSANLFYMHPVKPAESIAEAYFSHGVRAFSLDSQEELDKIAVATNHAQDLTLCVRLAVSSAHAKLSLAAKFGATTEEAPALLLATRQIADSLGICFHVGSQAMSPQAYSDALERVRSVIVKAGVTVDVIDVGGGFPSSYPGMEPPALTSYFDVIAKSFESLPVSYSAELWCEPGRALSAEYASLIVRVEKRRGDVLFINDGAYGSLFDAAHVGWRYPVKLLRASDAKPLDFSFYGPTCDDMDFMAGPFSLPADIQSGDYIEVGMIGAYGQVMKTNFNGFGATQTVLLADAPMLTLYDAVALEQDAPVAKAE